MNDGPEQAAPNQVAPNYKCHKEVYAFKIRQIVHAIKDGSAKLFKEEAGEPPVIVDKAYMDKHKPFQDGYFVVYKDGYRSFSPAKAFEEGYAKI